MSFFDPVLELLFPRFCVRCGVIGSYLCHHCLHRTPLIDLPLCPGCMGSINEPTVHLRCVRKSALDGLIAITHFGGETKELIIGTKYQGYHAMIEPLADLCALALHQRKTLLTLSPRALIPVPLSQERLRERGFNQSTLLCEHLSKKLKIPIVRDLVRKVRPTPTQASLKRRERWTNLEESFRCTSKLRKSDTVLLVDDVVTTGATLSAIAKTLKRSGCGKVYGLAVAHGH